MIGALRELAFGGRGLLGFIRALPAGTPWVRSRGAEQQGRTDTWSRISERNDISFVDFLGYFIGIQPWRRNGMKLKQ